MEGQKRMTAVLPRDLRPCRGCSRTQDRAKDATAHGRREPFASFIKTSLASHGPKLRDPNGTVSGSGCTADYRLRTNITAFVANTTFPFRHPIYRGTTRSDVPLSASGPLGGLQLCGPHLTPPIGLGPAGSSFPPPAHPTLGCLAPGNTWPFGFPSRCTILHRPSSGGHPVMNRSPVSGQNRYSVELDKTVENWNDCE